MNSSRFAATCVWGVVLLVAASGCSFSIAAPATIPAGDIAALAESTILDEFDAEIELDCGTEAVAFEVGTVIDCIGNQVGVDEQIPVRITIKLIDGDYYEIDITSDGPDSPESGSVKSDLFEEAVATALFPIVRENVVVDCGRDDIELFVGAEYICSVVLSTGFAEALVTVTGLEGSTYDISARLLE